MNLKTVIYVSHVMKNVNLALQQKPIVRHAFQRLIFRMDHVWKNVVLDIMPMIQIYNVTLAIKSPILPLVYVLNVKEAKKINVQLV